MGALMGFGLLGVLPYDLNIIEKEKIIKDFASQKWSGNFIELVFDYSGSENKLIDIYKGEVLGNEVRLTKLPIEENTELIKEWKKGSNYLDYDDWSVIFDADTFIPGSNWKEEDYEHYSIIKDSDGLIRSLEEGVRRVNKMKNDFITEKEAGYDGLEEDIERMDDYLKVFETAIRNNFIITFSS